MHEYEYVSRCSMCVYVVCSILCDVAWLVACDLLLVARIYCLSLEKWNKKRNDNLLECFHFVSKFPKLGKVQKGRRRQINAHTGCGIDDSYEPGYYLLYR